MGYDIALAISAAVVAIVGTLHDPKAYSNSTLTQTTKQTILALGTWDRKILALRLLILTAIIICVMAIGKAYYDNKDKELMKVGVTETLTATPTVINKVVNDVEKLIEQDGYGLNYGNSEQGMVFYFKKQIKGEGGTVIQEPAGSIVFSNSDLAKLYAKTIFNEDTSILLREAIGRRFDFSEYNEDLYSRLCALFISSVRRVLYKKPVDCHYDADRGITLTINVNNVEQQVVFSVREIKEYAGKETRSAFGQMDEAFRQKVLKTRDTPPRNAP